MMLKACSRCGKIHPANYNCTVGKIYTGGDERKERSKYSWTLKSEEVREKANYLCEVCKDQGKITYDNLEVHHIVPIRENKDLLLENENLICLCVDHHKQAERGQLDRDYLRKLAGMRERS